MSKHLIVFCIIVLLASAAGSVWAAPKDLKEFFPFGIWYQGRLTDKGIYTATMAEDIASLGINFAIANCSTALAPDSDEPASLASMLKLAEQHNIKMLVGLSPLIKTELTNLKPDEVDKTREEIKAKLAPFVAEGRKYSSLLGWWLGDEPIMAGVEKVKTAEKLRQIFRELDPDHHAWCEGGWSVVERDVIPHLQNLNEPVYMPEIYPFWNRPYSVGIGDFRYSGFKHPKKPQKDSEDWITRDLVDHFKDVRPHLGDRNLWPWLAAFREPSYSENAWDWRPPTTNELRCLSWITLAEGCKGLNYFGYEHMRHYGEHVDLFPVIKEIISDVAPITDVLLDCKLVKNIGKVTGGGSRYYKNALVETFTDSNSTLYLIVVNRNCEEDGRSRVSVSAKVGKAPADERWFAIDPAKNGIIAVGTNKGIKFELDLRPGEGKLVRLISSSQLHPVLEPKIKWMKVGDKVDYEITGTVKTGERRFIRWQMTGVPTGTLDPKTGRFKALSPGRSVIWARDEAGNTAFTREVVVE